MVIYATKDKDCKMVYLNEVGYQGLPYRDPKCDYTVRGAVNKPLDC